MVAPRREFTDKMRAIVDHGDGDDKDCQLNHPRRRFASSFTRYTRLQL